MHGPICTFWGQPNTVLACALAAHWQLNTLLSLADWQLAGYFNRGAAGHIHAARPRCSCVRAL
jgi:hypothetical protein